MSGLDVALLAVHAAFALAVIRIVGRRILPAMHALGDGEESQRACDLWIPVALSAPTAAASVHTSYGVATTGSAGITVPVAALLIGGGLAALRSQDRFVSPGGEPRRVWNALVATAVAGVVVLLLAAANRLSILAGQVIFAIWAVLLWFNSPPLHPSRDIEGGTDSEAAIAGGSLAAIALVAIVQSVAVALLSRDAVASAGGVSAIEAAIVLALLSARPGAPVTARVGSWLAVYGIALAIGLVSLSTLLRASWPIRDREAGIAMLYGPATGYSRFAVEAMVLLAVPVAIVLARYVPTNVRRLLGWLCIGGGALLAGWRLAGL